MDVAGDFIKNLIPKLGEGFFMMECSGNSWLATWYDQAAENFVDSGLQPSSETAVMTLAERLLDE